MTKINIQFSRFSAFYTPLIATMAGGFLTDEGLEYEWSKAANNDAALQNLADGTVDVAQSAVGVSLIQLARGDQPVARHFAQINELDGFFLAGRHVDPNFQWAQLEGSDVLVDHGLQPMAMFKYACLKAGIDFDKLNVIDAGGGADMEKAFRAGTGDYIHLQGPAPQNMEYEGVGYPVAAVGKPIGPCAFSSLAATPVWLATDAAKAFTRAYTRTRVWINEVPADEVARKVAEFFPETHASVLAECIATYQGLGNWVPRVEITEASLAVAQDVFQFAGHIKAHYPYDVLCAHPPAV
ncbi:ABC transporter substrate-binding protein [bacterium SCSIO 12827]|nr:ABC transporter substrate-binding protein [bacterium SCSIO 12827]